MKILRLVTSASYSSPSSCAYSTTTTATTPTRTSLTLSLIMTTLSSRTSPQSFPIYRPPRTSHPGIHAAFGVAKIKFYGFSWGTSGQVYATMFPSASGAWSWTAPSIPPDLVHRQCRPGLRLPGPHRRVLRLGGAATTASTTSAAPRRVRGRLVPGPEPVAGPPGQRDDRARRVR